MAGSHGPSTRLLHLSTSLGTSVWVDLDDMGGACQSLVVGLVCRTTYHTGMHTKTQSLHNVEKGIASYGSF